MPRDTTVAQNQNAIGDGFYFGKSMRDVDNPNAATAKLSNDFKLKMAMDKRVAILRVVENMVFSFLAYVSNNQRGSAV